VPLALDSEQAVLEGDLHVIVPDARHVRGYQVGVLVLGDVDRRCPRLAGRAGAGLLAELADPVGLAALEPAGLRETAGLLFSVCQAGQLLTSVCSRQTVSNGR
jgi:hypothetical protein